MELLSWYETSYEKYKKNAKEKNCCSALWLSVQAGLFIIVNIAIVITLKNSFKPHGCRLSQWKKKQYYCLVKEINAQCTQHFTLSKLEEEQKVKFEV